MEKRGALSNPVNRFERISYEPDRESEYPGEPAPKTEFFKDASKSIISYNNSPDVGFETSVNPYRGCEHGCIYCYARPTHEYFGLSSGVDFESKIFVKTGAPALLRRELSAPKWKAQVVVLSGVTDCYQPFERKFQLTRRCLEVLLDFRNPAAIITKSHLVTRDIDILKEMTEYRGIAVNISITTLDHHLARVMEPRASTPDNRLAAVEQLSRAGVPVNVMVAPIIPALTDQEIPVLLKKAREAGAVSAAYTIVRLPFSVKDLFAQWLGEHFPDRRKKILNRIRALRGGKLNDPDFGKRMSGEGVFAQQIHDLFVLAYKKAGFTSKGIPLATDSFCNVEDKQYTFLGD